MPFALYNHFLSDPCMSLRPMQNGKLDKQPRWSALELHILLLLRGKMLCLRLLWKLWLLSRCQVCAWPLPATVVYKRSISTFLGLSVLQFVVNHTWLGMNACVRTSHISSYIFQCISMFEWQYTEIQPRSFWGQSVSWQTLWIKDIKSVYCNAMQHLKSEFDLNRFFWAPLKCLSCNSLRADESQTCLNLVDQSTRINMD